MDTISQPCLNFRGGFAKQLLKVGHGWVIDTHINSTENTSYYGYKNPDYKPKPVWRLSHVHNGNPYINACKTSSKRIEAQFLFSHSYYNLRWARRYGYNATLEVPAVGDFEYLKR